MLLQTLEPLETDLPPDPVHHAPESVPEPSPTKQPSLERTIHGFPPMHGDPFPQYNESPQPVVSEMPQQIQATNPHFTQVPLPPSSTVQAEEPMEPSEDQIPTENDIRNLLLESDVFASYGLHSQSEDALQTILDYFPDHEEALLKLKDLYTATFSEPDINRVSLHLGGDLSRTKPPQRSQKRAGTSGGAFV